MAVLEMQVFRVVVLLEVEEVLDKQEMLLLVRHLICLVLVATELRLPFLEHL
jgi:hypothetical protein